MSILKKENRESILRRKQIENKEGNKFIIVKERYLLI